MMMIWIVDHGHRIVGPLEATEEDQKHPAKLTFRHLNIQNTPLTMAQFALEIQLHFYLNIDVEVTTVNVEKSFTIKRLFHNYNVYISCVYFVTETVMRYSQVEL